MSAQGVHAFLHRIVGTDRGYLVLEEVKTGARWTSHLTREEFGDELLTPEERTALEGGSNG